MPIVLAGCALVKGAPARVAPAPAKSNVSLEEMARLYPEEYNDWKDSVHGAAYLSGNRDAPACSDCHGDPASGEVETAAFRNEIAARCSRCHADAALMAKYDLPADIYDSYRADYHGTTIEFYRANDPSVWRYEATCSDCHNSHAIYKVDDPRSSVAPGNLLATCQKCHQGAEANFAAADSGHFRISAASSTLVFAFGLAYRILIPVIIGGMVGYIILDVVHRVRSRRA